MIAHIKDVLAVSYTKIFETHPADDAIDALQNHALY